MQCFVYRSRKKANTYLYIPKQDDFSDIPDGLMRLFGKPELALKLDLTPDRKLAVANASDIINSLNQQGFYLQMPVEDGHPA